jgi:hypothetical protein
MISEGFPRRLVVAVFLPAISEKSAYIKGPKARVIPVAGDNIDRARAWSIHAPGTYIIHTGHDVFILTVIQRKEVATLFEKEVTLVTLFEQEVTLVTLFEQEVTVARYALPTV